VKTSSERKRPASGAKNLCERKRPASQNFGASGTKNLSEQKRPASKNFGASGAKNLTRAKTESHVPHRPAPGRARARPAESHAKPKQQRIVTAGGIEPAPHE